LSKNLETTSPYLKRASIKEKKKMWGRRKESGGVEKEMEKEKEIEREREAKGGREERTTNE
jgi:hypothetical protein